MLTQMKITRFKRFDEVTIELANPVVFIGPNNSGKTSALQALALWSVGIRKWTERRKTGKATKRTGVSINRRELISIPLLRSHHLWRDSHVRKANTPLRIVIEVTGEDQGQVWTCGMEFETVDQDNIRCRPVTLNGEESDSAVRIPEHAQQVRMAFLPPMAGLISQEDLLQQGSIERRIGEGRTSDVLRNLCYRVYTEKPAQWTQIQKQIRALFGVTLLDPEYDTDTGTLSLEYKEQRGAQFDLNSAGQGFRQTLLLLAYLNSNQNTVLLLDEPDAHLELLRQRQIYKVLIDAARNLGNQLVIATHSEVILNDAAPRDLVVAFVGKPHVISKADKVRQALVEYGFDHYAQAEQKGFVLYLEGSTDLAILQTLADILSHPAKEALQAPFVHYVGNQPKKAEDHLYAIREAFPSLIGVAIFDHIDRLPENPKIKFLMWQRRELENYIVTPQALTSYAISDITETAIKESPLFALPEREKREKLMRRLIEYRIPPIALDNPEDNWWMKTKMTDDFLDQLFPQFFMELGLPNRFRKTDYHQLALFLRADELSPEIAFVLDVIYEAAQAGLINVKQSSYAEENDPTGRSTDIDD